MDWSEISSNTGVSFTDRTSILKLTEVDDSPSDAINFISPVPNAFSTNRTESNVFSSSVYTAGLSSDTK